GFFFSSRRRHTRLVSDWSSDVCSSDLKPLRPILRIPTTAPIFGSLSSRSVSPSPEAARRKFPFQCPPSKRPSRLAAWNGRRRAEGGRASGRGGGESVGEGGGSEKKEGR